MLQSSAAVDVNLIKRHLRCELLWRFPQDIDLTIRVKGPQIEIEGMV